MLLSVSVYVHMSLIQNYEFCWFMISFWFLGRNL